MTTTIKITELTNIGANLASSTLLPVVNMSGTPTTQKTVLGNIANVVLAGAGGNYVAAAVATVANTVTTNAQPNITSTGNLTSLTVSNTSGVVNFANTANVTLGAVGNLHIAGGTSGQVLTTDGSNVLSWTTVSGGNSNPFDQDLNTTDNVQFANVTSTEAIKFSNSGNIVGALGYAPAYVSIEGYGSNTVNITTNDVFTWSFGETGTLTFPVSSTSIFGGIDNDFTIATSNANGATYYFTFGQFGDLSVPANLNVSGNTYTNDIIGYGNSNVTITADANSWLFETDGILTVPGGGQIVPVSNTGVRLSAGASDATGLFLNGAGDAEIYANANVSIYTDAGNVGWTFDTTGNLTLPDNSSSINYANGTPYGGGGSGYIIPYEVATFVANTPPGFGEIQFADSEGANSAPATAQKLFINESPTNEQSMGTIFQQWTSNSYRGTLSLNNGSDSQATFNISNGRIYFEPETYRGFNAGLNQIWGDDCSINQLIITNATAPKFYNTEFLVENDVFHASGLATGNTHVMLNIYGSSQYNPINPNDLWNTFVAFVDNVLYDNTTLRTNPDDIKTQFYNNTGSFRNNIPTQDLFQYFRFTSSSDADYFGTAPTTTNGSGTGATVRIRVNPNNTYTVLGTALPGVGYIGGETLTVLGTDLGGVTPTNDLTILIDSVDGDGVITAVSYDSGTGVYPWPTNRISDGGDDQYDTGNYLNTNLASEISYANGITQTASAAFGGGDYCVMYYQSFFCMVATGVSSSVSDLFYSGDLGFDGDGALNWTGLRSNQSVIANNNALYAYFDSEYLDGELTPTVGTTYNMTLDSAGINLDGFYAYNDTNTGDTFFGSNTDWRVESQSQLYVQSYNDMIIQTLVNQRGIGETGPALTVQAGDGSPGQREINATAGNGGAVIVRGGDAGGSDGIDSLGNTGGRVEISGGVGSGNSQAGNVEINGGEGNNSGSINLRTEYGANTSGKITLNTGGNGTTNTWEFRSDGSTIVPTLTVDLHNGGNQQAQTLQFGDNTQQAIITGPTPDVTGSAQRLIIQGQRGSGTGEGGDVYLWAGDSDVYGGDIKIYAGDADNVSSGSGGYVNIAGGDGFDLGGYVSMQGGQSSNGQGAPASVIGGYGQSGGFANIVGGQGYAGPGGNVNITGGTSGNGLAEYGNVNIGAGASTWTFDNTGKLTFPRDAAGNTDPILSVTGGANPRILSEDASLAGPANLEITALNTIFTGSSGDEIRIYPDDGEIGSTGNLQLWANAGSNVAQYNWTFDTTGNLTVPGNTTVSTANATSGAAGKNISVIAGAADQSDYYTTSGGNVNITGGLGATNDGGGGGPGGWVNITSGASADPAGVYGNVKINTGGSNTWTFDNTGNLTTSSNLVISPSGIGTGTAIAQSDAILQIASTDANGSASIGWYGNPTGPGNVVQVALNQTGGSMTVVTGDYSDTTYVWDFDAAGNLTLPTGGNINYANGSPYGGSSVAEASFSIQSSNFNATAGSRYGIDTSGGAVTATLPASPSTGDAIFFADAGGAYSSNNLTIARNGQTIMGASSDLTVSTNNQSVGLFYNGSTWRIYNAG